MRFQTLGEARGILTVLGAITLVSALFFLPAALLGVVLVVYTFYFFRDPNRPIPADPLDVVAPADGVIVEIIEKEEPEVARATMRRVAIFLSVFDVHTNKAPIAGEVVYKKHFPGKCLDARNPECSIQNESLTWGFCNDNVTLVVRQITGAIARKIVGWSEVGDQVSKGDRFGMIRFGSRTEIYLPLDAEVTVERGQRVRGGETIIARLPAAKETP
jgi:phosphatidylserine decarboxylase